MTAILTLTRTICYLGIGLAIEAFCYQQDLPIRSLVDGSAPFSVFAHILAWPLFVLLWLLSAGMWLVVGLVALVVVCAMGYLIYDWMKPTAASRRTR